MIYARIDPKLDFICSDPKIGINEFCKGATGGWSISSTSPIEWWFNHP
jgi:hypothetical protein